MASNDEYQQRQFWEESPSICIEVGKQGECLTSVRFVMLDFSNQINNEEFCKIVKRKRNEQTSERVSQN